MAFKTSTVLSIAEKEFADHVRSPVFLLTAATFIIVVLGWTYVKGMEVAYVSNVLGMPDLMRGFKGMGSVVGQFVPLLGIITGFETIIKEIRSGSMNVLLGHPVYRDNIILGKILGSGLVIFLTLFLSINAATGILLVVSGLPVTSQYILRLELFVILTFFYTLFFSGLSVFVSLLVKKQNVSLICSLIIWLFLTIFFSRMIFTFLYAATSDPEMAEMWRLFLLNLAPGHHYALTAIGTQNVFGTLSPEPLIRGVFDTGFTLADWASSFAFNLLVLIGGPLILMGASAALFLRKDITL